MGQILQSSQTLKKSQKYQKLLKRDVSMSRILLIWVWAAGLQGQNSKKMIKTRQKWAKRGRFTLF
jgi:hypothetical protein